jgi:hypothetical protein
MRPETQLQRSIRQFLELRGFRSVAVPNGATLSGDGRQRAIQMANLKRDGLCPGFPDFLVYGPDKRMGHIEVKCEGAYQQPTQKAVQTWLTEWGHLYAVCRSLDDVEETLARWGWITPLRGPDGAKLRPVPPFISDDAEAA